MVILSARRINRLNNVRAILDLPESQIEGSRRGPLIRAAVVFLLGVLVTISAFQAAHLPFFGLGISLTVLGIAMTARAFGVPQQWVYTGTGLFLVVYWLIPHSYLKELKPDRRNSALDPACPVHYYSALYTCSWWSTLRMDLTRMLNAGTNSSSTRGKSESLLFLRYE